MEKLFDRKDSFVVTSDLLATAAEAYQLTFFDTFPHRHNRLRTVCDFVVLVQLTTATLMDDVLLPSVVLKLFVQDAFQRKLFLRLRDGNGWEIPLRTDRAKCTRVYQWVKIFHIVTNRKDVNFIFLIDPFRIQ